MLSNCGAGKDSWESLGQQDIKPLNPKGNQAWIFIGRTDAEADIHWLPDAKSQFIGQPGYSLATWCEELTHWKSPWCWERLKAGGEGDDRGWDDWMASPTQWTWLWANFGRQWRIGKPGMLESMGSQRVGHDWATEQQKYHCKSFRYLKETNYLWIHIAANIFRFLNFAL